MSDDDAYMALVTSNAQGELSPLEIGMHALGIEFDKRGNGASGGGLKAYAESVGRDPASITRCRQAAAVVSAINCVIAINKLLDKTAHLSAIHALPESCWKPAVEAMLSKGWSAKAAASKTNRGTAGRMACSGCRTLAPVGGGAAAPNHPLIRKIRLHPTYIVKVGEISGGEKVP